MKHSHYVQASVVRLGAFYPNMIYSAQLTAAQAVFAKAVLVVAEFQSLFFGWIIVDAT